MADLADIANDLIQDRMDAALAARRPAVFRKSAVECEGCGDPIPEARRVAVPGCVFCIDCQSFAEKRRA
ncbi:TPA: TraR/DksA C4-type zinc finger protein [Pseudomonas aeruginosa]